MFKNLAKTIEKKGKSLIFSLIKFLFPPKNISGRSVNKIEKTLIFRLDARIGNGLMLLPLANAIKKTSPKIKTDILINDTVASFFNEYQNGQFHKIWPYDQHYLLSRPWKFLNLILKLRREKYDVILNSTNPDSFSVSQAIFAKILKGKALIGFRTDKSAGFYDAEVQSSTKKHYADAMVDLWRYFYPEAPLIFGGLKPSETPKKEAVLFWLGATGNKHLSQDAVDIISAKVKEILQTDIDYAIGPADKWLLKDYREEIKKRIIVLEGSLRESAEFFRGYSLFISTDTGPMHLAATLNMPTFTVFTKKSHRQYGYNDGNIHFSYYIAPGSEEKELAKICERAFLNLKKKLKPENFDNGNGDKII